MAYDGTLTAPSAGDPTSAADQAKLIGNVEAIRATRKYAIIELYPADAVVEVGNGIKYLPYIPRDLAGMKIAEVIADVITPGTTGGLTSLQIYNETQAANVLSTELSIDPTESSSATAATPAVIDTGNNTLILGDRLRFDVTAVNTVPPEGLILTIGLEY